MTLDIIRSKFLSGPSDGLRGTIVETIAELETLYQGTTILNDVMVQAIADGVLHTSSFPDIRVGRETWLETTTRMGLIALPVGTDLQDGDLLVFRNSHHCAIYFNGAYLSKCTMENVASRMGHGDITTVPDGFGAYSVQRFSNA